MFWFRSNISLLLYPLRWQYYSQRIRAACNFDRQSTLLCAATLQFWIVKRDHASATTPYPRSSYSSCSKQLFFEELPRNFVLAIWPAHLRHLAPFWCISLHLLRHRVKSYIGELSPHTAPNTLFRISLSNQSRTCSWVFGIFTFISPLG